MCKIEILTQEKTDKEFYVYEYFSEKSGCITNMDGNEIRLSKGDVYYVGKGKGNRIDTGKRNNECENFKKEFGFLYRKIKEGLDEKSAFDYERETIEKYLNNGFYLTNVLSGSIVRTNNETIGVIKYLILLRNAKVIKISNEEISLETESYTEKVREISNNYREYNDIDAIIPDNIEYILKEYDYDSLTEKEKRYSNIKYVLDLADKGVIKANQADIARFYNEENVVINRIKSGKYKMVKKGIKPDNITDILIKFNPSNLTEEEKNKGKIMYIVKNFLDTRLLDMKITDLVRETKDVYNINTMQISDMKRSNADIKLVKPEADIIGKLFYKYYYPAHVRDRVDIKQ